MSTISIILIVYSALAVVIMLLIYIRSRKPSTPLDEFLGKKQKPIWKILLPLPIYPIVLVFWGLILLFDPKERKKRSVQKHLKTDKDFEKEYEKINVNQIDISEGLGETIAKETALCLGNALLGKDISSFSALLDGNIELVLYGEKRYELISGRAAVEKYWRDWIIRQKEKGLTHKFKVVRTEYFTTEALEIDYYDSSKRYCGAVLVVFAFNEQGKIERLIMTSSYIYYTHFTDNKHSFLRVLECLSPHITASDINTGSFDYDRHLPCLECGTKSEDLIWLGFHNIAYHGNISFCPNCKEIVEEYVFMHSYVDYEHDYFPINDNIEYIEKKIAEGYKGGCCTYYDKPIGWQKHIYFYDDSVLDLGQPEDWSEEKKLQYAIEKGEFEAYNNLALLYVGEDDDKALEYFGLAVENNIPFGIFNLSLWYYKHNDLPNFIKYTRLAANNNDVIAMYNLAFVQFSNEFDIQDINSAIEQYKKTIEECDRIKLDRISNNEEDEIGEEWDNTVLQRSYYDLAVIYYRKGNFEDLLLSYAYLNQCPRQIDMVKDLKTTVYLRLLDRHTEYYDLPF